MAATDFLTLPTFGDLPIVATSAEEQTPTPIGDSSRAFDGTLRSSITGEKREWRVTTWPLSIADARAVRAELAAAPFLAVGGGIVDEAEDGTLSCEVRVVGTTYLRDGSTTHRRQLVLALREV